MHSITKEVDPNKTKFRFNYNLQETEETEEHAKNKTDM